MTNNKTNPSDMREAFSELHKQYEKRFVQYKKDERHHNNAETEYWLKQYKNLAWEMLMSISTVPVNHKPAIVYDEGEPLTIALDALEEITWADCIDLVNRAISAMPVSQPATHELVRKIGPLDTFLENHLSSQDKEARAIWCKIKQALSVSGSESSIWKSPDEKPVIPEGKVSIGTYILGDSNSEGKAVWFTPYSRYKTKHGDEEMFALLSITPVKWCYAKDLVNSIIPISGYPLYTCAICGKQYKGIEMMHADECVDCVSKKPPVTQ